MTASLRRQGLIVVGTLAVAYMASHFFRASNVTIGLDLMRDLQIGPQALGALTGAFFFGFAAMQLPCGFFFDRYGPRLTVFGMLLLATLGGAIFTLAPSWPVLVAGRALMGAGFGVMLIGSMVVIARWFPPEWFSTMSSMVMSIGLIGNLLATSPLAWGIETVGWRTVFGGVVVFTGLAAIAVLLIVRDAPPGHPFLAREPESPIEMLRGLKEVFCTRHLPFILVLNFTNYACTFTLQGLWGGPWLREVHGMTRIESGNVLFMAVIAYQLGVLTIGPLDRVLNTRKWIAFTGSLVVAVNMATLALWRAPPDWVPVASILIIGYVSACSTMVMAHARGLFPDRLIGRGMATVNATVMLGVACMQTLSGIILGTFQPLASGARSDVAYRSLFGFMAAVLIVALSIYIRAPDVKPRAVGRE